jgi:2,3-bisphosphoglycerate-dependent phosphoglycerate mutase
LHGTRLLLARHAETAAPDRFHGAESDIGLSARGFEQAKALGRWLEPAGAVAPSSSSMRRARETAGAVGAVCGLVPFEQPLLHERRLGPLSGLSREDGWSIYEESKRRWIAGELEYSHPGGESFGDIRRRVGPIFDELATTHAGETIIVVAHGVVIRVVITTMVRGFQPADFDRVAIEFASLNDLWHDGTGWTARALNQVVTPSPVKPGA